MAIDPGVLQTALYLTLAHLVADYPFQTSWMVSNKAKWTGMAAHIAVVFLATLLALKGQLAPAVAITGTHLTIDLLKTHALPSTLWSYLLDQALHMATILAMLIYWPGLASGWDLAPPELHYALFAACGFIISVWFGGPVIGALMKTFDTPEYTDKGLPGGGQIIGMLERGLIFPLVLAGEPAGVGFLIAAKSVLRFETTKERNASEYVIVGTLASFGWAILTGFVVLGLLRYLDLGVAFS